MPKLLEILDQLEEALPEFRTVLESNPDYMKGDMDEEEGGLPPLPDEEGADPFAEGGEEEPLDLESPPPPKKKKPFPPMV